MILKIKNLFKRVKIFASLFLAIDRNMLCDRSHIRLLLSVSFPGMLRSIALYRTIDHTPWVIDRTPLTIDRTNSPTHRAIDRNSSGDRSRRTNFASVPFPLYVRSIASFRAIDRIMLSSVFL